MRPLICIISFLCLTLSSADPLAADNLPAVRLLISNPAPYVGEEVIVTLEVRTAPRSQSAIIPIWPNLDSSASAELPTLPPVWKKIKLSSCRSCSALSAPCAAADSP
jgi:hypothetical protein